jgi:carbamoylphosphate synthase large subunit
MRADFLAVRDPEWSAFLDGTPHDFYHLPAYVDLCARHEGGEATAFLARGDGGALLVPLVLRPVPARLDPDSGWRDASAPYGYPSPLLSGDPGVLDGCLAAFRQACLDEGIVSVFLRFNPLLPVPLEPFRAQGRVLDHGETVLLDLALPPGELQGMVRDNVRAAVRKLLEAGYEVSLDDWGRLPDFERLYGETMDIHGATGFYRFGPDYFRELRACLGDRLHLCVVQAPGGETASAGLFTEVEGYVQYHLCGTSLAHRRAAPSKLMVVHMRDWAQARGNRFLHLGGGVGGQADSLFKFKAGFSHGRAPFRTCHLVPDPQVYERLVHRAWGGEPDTDFFPAYRATPERKERPMGRLRDQRLTLLRTAAGSPPTVTQYKAFQALGCRIVAADCNPASVGFHFADAAYVVPRVGEPGYLERMLEICAREGVDLFMPALDEELLLCSLERGRFEALGTRLLVSGPEALAVCTDKLATWRFFREAGIPTPRTVAAAEYREGSFPPGPLVVKPRVGRGGTGVHLARTHAEAAFFCGYVPDAIVQERLEGVEYTIDVLADLDSEVRILSPRKRLATDSGISSRGATHWREDLPGPVRAMVKGLALVGPLNVQCFVAPAGEVSFTEINARMAGTVILSQAAGVPFFEGILELARGRVPADWLKPGEALVMYRYWEEVFRRPDALLGREG